MEECVQRHMASLAGELQKILQHVTDELATEVNREQQHLILMQDQVCHVTWTHMQTTADNSPL